MIDFRYRDAFAEAAGPLQFGYCAPAGTDQAVMLMRILRELFPDNAVLLCDVAKAFNSLSKEAVFEALEEWPKLRSLVPYARRKANTSPLLLYYANGRFDGMSPTAFLRMLDGFIQGHTLSSPFFAITLTYALKKVREKHVPHALLECFADDTSGSADTQQLAPVLKEIGEALKEEAGVGLSCPKTKIVLPAARTAADVAAMQQVTAELLALGVKRENIHDDALRADDVARDAEDKQAGSKLLGAAVGTPSTPSACCAAGCARWATTPSGWRTWRPRTRRRRCASWCSR